MISSLSDEQVRQYAYDGYVLVDNVFNNEEIIMIQQFADAIAALPPSNVTESGSYTQHFERRNGERALCRVENFVPFHEGLGQLAAERIAPLVSQLFGEEACLFKEKINFKGPLGGGYAPHYDGPSAAAVGLASTFVTAQLAIDEQTIENGCLFGVYPKHECSDTQMVAPEEGGDPDVTGRAGAIPADVAASMTWKPLPAPAGSVLLFNHWFAHRSPPNRSNGMRRTAYFIYNAASEGDHHELYYYMMAEARRKFAQDARSCSASVVSADAVSGDDRQWPLAGTHVQQPVDGFSAMGSQLRGLETDNTAADALEAAFPELAPSESPMSLASAAKPSVAYDQDDANG